MNLIQNESDGSHSYPIPRNPIKTGTETCFLYYYSVYVNTFKELFPKRKPPHRWKASAKVDIEPETTKQSGKKIQMKNEFFALTDKTRTQKQNSPYYIYAREKAAIEASITLNGLQSTATDSWLHHLI